MTRALNLPGFAACWRHADRLAVAGCDDCGKPVCQACAVVVPGRGRYCVDCAMQRGGVHPNRRQQPVEPVVGPLDSLHESESAVRQFEARMVGRPPHHLISGLTERLVREGVDPAHTIDGPELYAAIDLLRASADHSLRHPLVPSRTGPRKAQHFGSHHHLGGFGLRAPRPTKPG